jgi:hypothetical protein
MNPRTLAWLVALVGLLPAAAQAHIGNAATIYEGSAGQIPVRVNIRVPTVVPGLAEVSVRILTNGTYRVTALPAHVQSGPQGRPPPDLCQPVAGESNLHHAQLWLMARGTYGIEVDVSGPGGSGRVVVPVNALATTQLPMSPGLRLLLASLGLLLFLAAIAAAGAAVREAVLPPGELPGRRRRWLGRGAMALSALLLGGGLWGGWIWWQAEARHYRDNRLHRPSRIEAQILPATQGATQLEVNLLPPTTSGRRHPATALVPDHGKLMHLFLLREQDGAGFAHLHPVRREDGRFAAVLPPLPPGRYHLYADLTHESGFSQTVTALVSLAAAPLPAPPSDPEDSWWQADTDSPQAAPAASVPLGDGFTLHWERPAQLVARQELTLRFRVSDAQGNPAELEPYLNMLAHAVIWRTDGAVFTHLHPAGTASLASQQVLQLRSGSQPPRRITAAMMEALCQPPGPDLRRSPLSFPYEFPEPGRHRLWVQIKAGGLVRTGSFLAEIQPR